MIYLFINETIYDSYLLPITRTMVLYNCSIKLNNEISKQIFKKKKINLINHR